MNNHPELSIIILCYRSEKQILEFADKVKQLAEKLTTSFEIILVANYIEGTNDQTMMYVNQIAKTDKAFVVVSKPKKGMMGWDMREGLNCAKGNLLCVIDGDGQFPHESIKQCYESISKGPYELVKTYRVIRKDGFYRKFISSAYNFLFSILFGTSFKDINSKPKIFTREVYSKMSLTSDDWFIDAEIMININRLNIRYHELPIDFQELSGRKSFVKMGAILEFTRNMLIHRFKK